MKQENEICSLEQSKALKQLGFHGKTYCFYAKSEEEGTWLTSSANGSCHDWNMREERDCPFMTVVCSAPMLWTALKWLREKKELSVEVISKANFEWSVDVCKIEKICDTLWHRKGFLSYESALSAGITQAINLLNQEKK